MNDKLSVEMLNAIITHANVAASTEPFTQKDEYTVIDKDGTIVAEYENQIDAYLCVICPPSSIKSMASEILDLRAKLAAYEQAAREPVAWPKSFGEPATGGWTLDWDFLDKVNNLAGAKYGYRPGMEEVEAALLAAIELFPLYTTTPEESPSEPVAWQWHYYKQWHVTNDPERARDVAAGGIDVQALGVIPVAPTASAVPAGWKLAPEKANIAMIRAGGKAAREYMEENGGNSPQIIYQAMLAAAPSSKIK